jgi:hypothetical protein
MSRRTLVSILVLFALIGGGFVAWRATIPTPAPDKPAGADKATASSRSPAAPAAPASPAPPPPPAASGAAEPAPSPPRVRTPKRKPEAPVEAAAPAPATGTLHIDSDIPGAQVFIDRRFVGVTPLTETDVAPGPHRINVAAAGHESLAEDVEVSPGPRDLLFKFKEIRLAAAIAVVHKHRLGSCKGQLVASPGGLRYDTIDKDDAFSVPLDNFETFEVDYLGKVLKMKVKKGKRYEFADPDANADRLFVFHRDVDKVRQRLSQ